MSALAERYEAYLKKHAEFVFAMEQIETVKRDSEKLEGQLGYQKREYNNEKQHIVNVKSQLGEMETRLESYEVFLTECKYGKDRIRKNINPKFFFVKNEYTDFFKFRRRQEEIRSNYEERMHEYYAKRKTELEIEKEKILQEKEVFSQSKESQVLDDMEKMYPDSKSELEKKKQGILQYLKANAKIKEAEESKSILRVIENETVSQTECGISEEDLMHNVLALQGTDGYAREHKINRREFKDYRSRHNYNLTVFFTQYGGNSQYQSNCFYPFLGITAAVLLIAFMLGFTPMKFIIPSSEVIAGAGQSIVQMIIRIGCSLLAACIVYGVVRWVLEMMNAEMAGVIVGILAGILLFYVIFTKYYPKISVQSMMWFGIIIHFIIALILNLLLCSGIIILLYNLILNTKLSDCFFKMNEDIVLLGLKQFERIFFEHREEYLMLFHIEEALNYARENRLQSEMKLVLERINGITDESGYIKLEEDCKAELNERENERKNQLYSFEKKIIELKEDCQNKEQQIYTLEKKLKGQKDVISDLEIRLTKCRKQEETMNCCIAEDKKDLLNATEKLVEISDIEFDKQCNEMNTPMELLACDGKWCKQLYFVRNSKDKYKMAILKKLTMAYDHNVFVYEKSDISRNNLSEELSGFIEWLIKAVRRTNPAGLLSRYFTVVDLMSGRSILTMPPYDQYIQVIDDEKGKNSLVNALGKKIMNIAEEMNDPNIRKLGGRIDGIDSLNEKKMMINKRYIDKKPTIALQDMQEKLIGYHIIIFIIPDVVENGSQPSVLNDELKKILMNVEHYGIIPVFLVASDTWNDAHNSADVSYLQRIQNKSVWHILGVGKGKEMALDIV